MKNYITIFILTLLVFVSGGKQDTELDSASFTGNGTEPFWGFSASGSTLILREPSDSGPMDEIIYSGISISQQGEDIKISNSGLNVTMYPEICSDGMSEIVYDYSVEFVAGDKIYSGCALQN